MAGDDFDVTMDDVNLDTSLFAGCKVAILPSDKLSEDSKRYLTDSITSRAGEFVLLHDQDRIRDVEKITHIISGTSDFPDYFDALDHLKHVVKPSWVKESIQRGKLQNPRQYSPDPALFMSDVIVCCADLPEGDKEAIYGGVMAMGGLFSTALSKMVTHLVALDIRTPVVQKAIQKNLKCNIVLPHWFDTCFKLGAKVSESKYLLADPQFLGSDAKAPVESKPSATAIGGATSPRPKHEALPTLPIRTVSVFKNKKLKISDQLELGLNMSEAIAQVIEKNGGKVTDRISEADTLICQYRDGADYVEASRAGKDVGTLSWLYYLISHNKWTSPLRRLLHYPIPRDGIPDFSGFRISLSNYTGEARAYLSSLVEASGAKLDRTMTEEDTHLIAAYMDGAKCEAAKEWNINIVNHLWLETSYAHCKPMSISNPKFTYFPKATNLGEAVGQTQLDRGALERFYTGDALTRVEAARARAEKTGQHELEAEEQTPIAKTTRQPRGEKSVQTPVSRLSADKENQSPSTTNSRGAKARALSKLNDLAPDVALFEKEMKRVGGVVHGKERGKGADEDKATSKKAKGGRISSESRKRSLEPDLEDDAEASQTPPKKAKNGKRASKETKQWLMLTKYEGWEGKPQKESSDRMKLRELNIWVTEDPRPDMILCAPKLVRTKKFLRAIAYAPHVVSTDFLDHCLKNQELPDVDDYHLLDKEGEERWGLQLSKVISRARRNQGRLLKDMTIFCTESVSGGWETIKEIIFANGGTCQLYQGRSVMNVSKRGRKTMPVDTESQDQVEEDDKDVAYLISDTLRKDIPIWQKFRLLAEKHDMVPRIVSTEWLLAVAMEQRLLVDDHWFLSEDNVDAKSKK